MFDFDALSQATARQTVLCVGDLMLDEFVYGEVSRISPEAPAPVIAVRRSETNIGGAGNVARTIAALGTRCIFVGLVGDDAAGAVLRAALAREAGVESMLVTDPGRPTTRKVRFVSEHFSTHMLRADWERAAPAAGDIDALTTAVQNLIENEDRRRAQGQASLRRIRQWGYPECLEGIRAAVAGLPSAASSISG